MRQKFSWILLLGFMLFSVEIFSQVKSQIPVSLLEHSNSKDVDQQLALLKENFDTGQIKASSFTSWSSGKGLFVIYEKLDTLTAGDPFFDSNRIEDYTLVGLAFYLREGQVFKQQFANDEAFFCLTCNNMKDHGVVVKGNKLDLFISWGPSVAYANDKFSFAWDGKNWKLAEHYKSYMNDSHEALESLSVFPKNNSILLSNFQSEFGPYDETWPKPIHNYSLEFNVDDISKLRDALKKYPKADYDQLPRLLEDVSHFFYMADLMESSVLKVDKTNVTALNDIAYYLEQANMLDDAAYILDAVLEAYPEREVAHLNRGDVYLKEKNFVKAKSHYERYVQLMRNRKLDAKIPKRVLEFIN